MPGKKKSINYGEESQKKFLALSGEQKKVASTFTFEYGPEQDDKIEWTILKDGEEITDDPMEHPFEEDGSVNPVYDLALDPANEPQGKGKRKQLRPPVANDGGGKKGPFKKDIPWDPESKDVDYNDIFFEHFFPSLKGKAKVLDEYLADSRCSMRRSVQNDNIKFHRPDRDDPDELLKICVTLMIAACLEVDSGVENLWKRGQSDGYKDYANYGQHIPVNYFRAFICGFPALWADKKYWHLPARDVPWEYISTFVDEYNEKRTTLLRVIYLMLDETMSGWRPKTSKTGGFPHITHEPRKPVSLGTMLRNGVECITGIFVHHDIVRASAEQWEKKYSNPPTRSHLPKRENIQYHVAEVLRQAEESGIEAGGWVGGDAWFGSINSCVELYKRLGVFSTFIVKQNLNYFPMQVLHAVLRARYPRQTAGHWVVMKTTISGVDLFIMAYAWSNRGVAYMVSSCGKTVRHSQNYTSRFEDDFGNVQVKELPRPTIAHFLYEFLPLIDEHNKARQNVLALEKSWLTKDCWFRLVTTFVGMAVVDLQRWDRNMRHHGKSTHALCLDEGDEDFGIKKLANLIARPLRTGKLRYRDNAQPVQRNAVSSEGALVRIMDADGCAKSQNGKPRTSNCFICRKYQPKHKSTIWVCSKCGMPLCQVGRGREQTCLEEHLSSSNPYLGCGYIKRECFTFPANLRVWRKTRAAAPQGGRKRSVPEAVSPSPVKTARKRSKFTGV
ncbi:hypothetical protein ACHAWF_012745 [Thalassiosira exigua]